MTKEEISYLVKKLKENQEEEFGDIKEINDVNITELEKKLNEFNTQYNLKLFLIKFKINKYSFDEYKLFLNYLLTHYVTDFDGGNKSKPIILKPLSEYNNIEDMLLDAITINSFLIKNIFEDFFENEVFRNEVCFKSLDGYSHSIKYVSNSITKDLVIEYLDLKTKEKNDYFIYNYELIECILKRFKEDEKLKEFFKDEEFMIKCCQYSFIFYNFLEENKQKNVEFLKKFFNLKDKKYTFKSLIKEACINNPYNILLFMDKIDKSVIIQTIQNMIKTSEKEKLFDNQLNFLYNVYNKLPLELKEDIEIVYELFPEKISPPSLYQKFSEHIQSYLNYGMYYYTYDENWLMSYKMKNIKIKKNITNFTLLDLKKELIAKSYFKSTHEQTLEIIADQKYQITINLKKGDEIETCVFPYCGRGEDLEDTFTIDNGCIELYFKKYKLVHMLNTYSSMFDNNSTYQNLPTKYQIKKNPNEDDISNQIYKFCYDLEKNLDFKTNLEMCRNVDKKHKWLNLNKHMFLVNFIDLDVLKPYSNKQKETIINGIKNYLLDNQYNNILLDVFEKLNFQNEIKDWA